MNAIISMLMGALGKLAPLFFAFSAGENKQENKDLKDEVEDLAHENKRLNNRPRNLRDRLKRLRDWKNKLPRNS